MYVCLCVIDIYFIQARESGGLHMYEHCPAHKYRQTACAGLSAVCTVICRIKEGRESPLMHIYMYACTSVGVTRAVRGVVFASFFNEPPTASHIYEYKATIFHLLDQMCVCNGTICWIQNAHSALLLLGFNDISTLKVTKLRI